MPDLTPFLWFDTQAEEAATYYTSIFDDGKITQIRHHGDAIPDQTRRCWRSTSSWPASGSSL